MTQAEQYLSEEKALFPRRLSAVFLSLLLCMLTGAAAAYGLARFLPPTVYEVASPVPFSTVYGFLLALAAYLRHTVIETLFVFFSAFTLSPGWIGGAAAIYRGVVMGISLSLMTQGLVRGGGNMMPAVLSLFFFASTLLLLFASYASVYGRAFFVLRRLGDRERREGLLFEYFKCFGVMSGAVFAVSALGMFLR